MIPLSAFLSFLGDIKCIIIAFDDPNAGKQQREHSQADTFMYIKQNGCAIYRKTQEYPIPYKRSSKTHGKVCKVSQFPLKLAWASTGHKVQGITIKKFTNLVVHGHKRLPEGMYYLMLSRSQTLENTFMENFSGNIRANSESLKENKNLVEKSIVQSYKENHFSIFMVNIRSLRNKIIDLEKDIYAQKADHICVVETWLNPNYRNDLTMEERLVLRRFFVLYFMYILI